MKRIILTAAFAAATLMAQTPAGDAKQGKQLFLNYACYSCHSFDGHGGAGARLVPMPLKEAAFIAFVRNAGRMPSYSPKAISDAKLADIYAYIKTLPTSPDAKDIPLIQELLKEN